METKDLRIQRALELIEERLHERLRVDELASIVGLSVSQFTRLFRQATGSTPGAYLNARRLSRARTLVGRTSLSVAEIMRQVGFSDRSHFARDFQRAHGFSPRTLRVQLRHSGRCLQPSPWFTNR
jgi:AraC family transcriptional regulator of arabinose operon